MTIVMWTGSVGLTLGLRGKLKIVADERRKKDKRGKRKNEREKRAVGVGS